MSRKILFDPEKASRLSYLNWCKMGFKSTQDIVAEFFKTKASRRKCYRLSEFEVKVHATEYYMDLFKETYFGGRKQYSVDESIPENVESIRQLVQLAAIYSHNVDYDEMLERLESVHEKSDVSSGIVVPIIPNVLYAYSTKFKPETIYFKLEYFFGADVITVLDSRGYEIRSSGSKRQNFEDGRKHAIKVLMERSELVA